MLSPGLTPKLVPNIRTLPLWEVVRPFNGVFQRKRKKPVNHTSFQMRLHQALTWAVEAPGTSWGRDPSFLSLMALLPAINGDAERTPVVPRTPRARFQVMQIELNDTHMTWGRAPLKGEISFPSIFLVPGVSFQGTSILNDSELFGESICSGVTISQSGNMKLKKHTF